MALTEYPTREPAPQRLGVTTVSADGRPAAEVVAKVMAELAEEPRVLECDLAGLVAEGTTIAEHLAPVGHYLRHWPGTVLLIHVPDPVLRSELAAADYADAVVIHADWDDAAVEDHRLLPNLQHTSMFLSPEPTAPAVARAFVAHTMQQWQLPSLTAPASQVLSELVTHAAINGDSDLEVSLSRVEARIRIAMTNPVADTPADMSNLPEYPLTGRAGQLVQALVDGWGVIPRRPTGCTVWATIDACSANAPDETTVTRPGQPAGRHRGAAADTDALAELHHRTLGRHRRSR